MRTTLFLALFSTQLLACNGGVDTEGEDDGDRAFAVSGTVVDFETGEPLEQATVSTSGLRPPPAVTVDGAAFSIDGVPLQSVFNLLVGSPPDYRSTYAAAIVVEDEALHELEVAAVSDAYLAALGEAFGIDVAGTSAIFVRALDEDGAPRAGVPAAAFSTTAATSGPFFLDAELQPVPAFTETSSSGWVVFFDLDPGLVELAAPEGSGFTLEMPASPSDDGTVTLADAVVRDGEAERPVGVSYQDDIRPIFERRGCEGCHSGNGPGKDLGNLQLDGGLDKIYRELTQEVAVNAASRVNVADPDASLVLTMPSAEDPADGHPNVTFASANDPDYVLLQVWIEEGAKL